MLLFKLFSLLLFSPGGLFSAKARPEPSALDPFLFRDRLVMVEKDVWLCVIEIISQMTSNSVDPSLALPDLSACMLVCSLHFTLTII